MLVSFTCPELGGSAAGRPGAGWPELGSPVQCTALFKGKTEIFWVSFYVAIEIRFQVVFASNKNGQGYGDKEGDGEIK